MQFVLLRYMPLELQGAGQTPDVTRFWTLNITRMSDTMHSFQLLIVLGTKSLYIESVALYAKLSAFHKEVTIGHEDEIAV